MTLLSLHREKVQSSWHMAGHKGELRALEAEDRSSTRLPGPPPFLALLPVGTGAQSLDSGNSFRLGTVACSPVVAIWAWAAPRPSWLMGTKCLAFAEKGNYP